MALNTPIKDWKNKRVWVIGASTGIGAETAKFLLKKGAKVVLSARRSDVLESVANASTNSLVIPLDIIDEASVKSAFQLILEKWKDIDLVLVVACGYNELVLGIEKGEFHIHFPKRFTNILRFARLLPYRWYFALIKKVTGL